MRPPALALVCVLLSTPVAAQQAAPRWQASLSTFVSAGTYGTPDTTHLVYTTLSVRRTFPRGDVTFRVPQIHVTTTGTVLVYRGVPQLSSRAEAGTATRQTTTPTRGDTTPVAVEERLVTTAAGIGDVSIGGRVYLVEGDGRRPTVDLFTRLDLPSGDSARGLGLGAASAQIGIDAQTEIGRRLLMLGSASFTAAGHADTVTLRNPWEYSAGLGLYLTRAVLITGSYEQWRSIVPGTPTGRDLLATGTVAAGRHLRLLLSAQMPLSEQAPDFGAGVGLAVRF